MFVLSLEASTTAAKALVYGLGVGVAAEASVPYPASVGDVRTLSAPGVYDCLLEAGRRAVREAAQPIDAVALCTIWHSLLLADDFGEPLTRAMTWANTDAAPDAAAVRADEELRDYLYSRTGCMPHSLFPLMQLKYLKRTAEGMLNRSAGLWSLPVYLLKRLTGEPIYSKCTASGSGMFNIHTLKWDAEIMERFGLDTRKLPKLCEAGAALTLTQSTADALGIGRVPCAAGGSDGALNQIGAGAMGAGVMTLSVGTSGALRVAVDAPLLPPKPSTWCYYVAGGKRIAGAATSGCCNCIDWLRGAVLGGMEYGAMDAMLSEQAGAYMDAPLFLPFLWGERCPGWNDARGGGFVDIKGHHGAEHLYYAVLEGILLNLKQCYEILVSEGGAPREVRVSGGIVNSGVFQRMAADILGRTLHISPQSNASTMGGAAVALNALGVLPDLAQFPAARGRPVEPDAGKREFYEARFGKYLEAYCNVPR